MWAQWKEHNWPLEKFTWNSTSITDYEWRQSQYEPLTTCCWATRYLSSVLMTWESLFLEQFYHKQSTLALWEGRLLEADWYVLGVQWRGWEQKEEKGRHILSLTPCPSVPAPWVKITSLHYGFPEDTARTDCSGASSETERRNIPTRETEKNKTET